MIVLVDCRLKIIQYVMYMLILKLTFEWEMKKKISTQGDFGSCWSNSNGECENFIMWRTVNDQW